MMRIFNQSFGLAKYVVAMSIYTLSVYSALERSDPYLALSSYFSGAFFVIASLLLGEFLCAMCNSERCKVYILGGTAIFIWLLAGILPGVLFGWSVSNEIIADLHALMNTCLESALWTVSLVGFISLIFVAKNLGNLVAKSTTIAIAILGALCSFVFIV